MEISLDLCDLGCGISQARISHLEGLAGPVASQDGTIGRIAYQANVLLEARDPELQSILVRTNESALFAPETSVPFNDTWEFQINLTGPVIDPAGLTVTVQSDNEVVPIVVGFVFPSTEGTFTIAQGQSSAFFLAPRVGEERITANITASAGNVSKSAVVYVFEIK